MLFDLGGKHNSVQRERGSTTSDLNGTRLRCSTTRLLPCHIAFQTGPCRTYRKFGARPTSCGSGSRDPPEPRRPDSRQAIAPKGRHTFPHVPEDRNCETSKRTKLARGVCRRNSQSQTLGLTKFEETFFSRSQSSQ